MASKKIYLGIAASDHGGYMEYTLEMARQSPPEPTKFCLAAVLVDVDMSESGGIAGKKDTCGNALLLY